MFLSPYLPKFLTTFIARDAGAVIHSHSKAAVIATLLAKDNEFHVTHLEMIKVLALLLLSFSFSKIWNVIL